VYGDVDILLFETEGKPHFRCGRATKSHSIYRFKAQKALVMGIVYETHLLAYINKI
jgi:hypothetical protein